MTNELFTVEGVKVFCTHGHLEHVKYGFDYLYSIASADESKLVLFGHTHYQYHEYLNGVHLFNPGAVMEGCYGLVDIIDGQIMCIGANIYDN